MENKDPLEKVFSNLPSISTEEVMLKIEAGKTLKDTIPSAKLHMGFDFFSQFKRVDEKVNLEIALLTNDSVLHDFTFNIEQNTIVFSPITVNTIIRLRSFYSRREDSLDNLRIGSKQPYRASLEIIFGANEIFTYSAEGDRLKVKELLDFGVTCLTTLHKVERGAKNDNP